MALDNRENRQAALHPINFWPGQLAMLDDIDDNDLQKEQQRGTILYHYTGIPFDGPEVNSLMLIGVGR